MTRSNSHSSEVPPNVTPEKLLNKLESLHPYYLHHHPAPASQSSHHHHRNNGTPIAPQIPSVFTLNDSEASYLQHPTSQQQQQSLVSSDLDKGPVHFLPTDLQSIAMYTYRFLFIDVLDKRNWLREVGHLFDEHLVGSGSAGSSTTTGADEDDQQPWWSPFLLSAAAATSAETNNTPTPTSNANVFPDSYTDSPTALYKHWKKFHLKSKHSSASQQDSQTAILKQYSMHLWLAIRRIQLELWIYQWIVKEQLHSSSQHQSTTDSELDHACSMCVIPIYHARQTPPDSTSASKIPLFSCAVCLRVVDVDSNKEVRPHTVRDIILGFNEHTLEWILLDPEPSVVEASTSKNMSLLSNTLASIDTCICFWKKPQNHDSELLSVCSLSKHMKEAIKSQLGKDVHGKNLKDGPILALVRGYLNGMQVATKYAVSTIAFRTLHLSNHVSTIVRECAHLLYDSQEQQKHLVFFPHSFSPETFWDECLTIYKLSTHSISVHIASWSHKDQITDQNPLLPLLDKTADMCHVTLAEYVDSHGADVKAALMHEAQETQPAFHKWLKQQLGKKKSKKHLKKQKNVPKNQLFTSHTMGSTRLYTCNVCGDSSHFLTRAGFSQHVHGSQHQKALEASKQKAPSNIECNCGESFTSLDGLRQHAHQCTFLATFFKNDGQVDSSYSLSGAVEKEHVIMPDEEDDDAMTDLPYPMLPNIFVSSGFNTKPPVIPAEHRTLVYTPSAVDALTKLYRTDMIESANDIVQLVSTILKRRYKADLLEPQSSELRKEGTVVCHIVELKSNEFLFEGSPMSLMSLGKGSNLTLAKKFAAINMLVEMQQRDMIGEETDPNDSEIQRLVNQQLRRHLWK